MGFFFLQLGRVSRTFECLTSRVTLRLCLNVCTTPTNDLCNSGPAKQTDRSTHKLPPPNRMSATDPLIMCMAVCVCVWSTTQQAPSQSPPLPIPQQGYWRCVSSQPKKMSPYTETRPPQSIGSDLSATGNSHSLWRIIGTTKP